MKISLILASILLVSGCDSYDSYAECMNEYEIDARSAYITCPECENDWSKLRQEAVKRCSKYTKPYEL